MRKEREVGDPLGEGNEKEMREGNLIAGFEDLDQGPMTPQLYILNTLECNPQVYQSEVHIFAALIKRCQSP